MSLKNCLGKVLLLSFLEVGALCGAPVRPEEIEEIMKMSSQPVVTYVVRNEDGDGPPAPDLMRRRLLLRYATVDYQEITLLSRTSAADSPAFEVCALRFTTFFLTWRRG